MKHGISILLFLVFCILPFTLSFSDNVTEAVDEYHSYFDHENTDNINRKNAVKELRQKSDNSDIVFCDTISTLPKPFEKAYLHLDRHYYMPGDDIWLKANLVDAQNNRPAPGNSKTLYVELISPKSDIIGRKVLYLDSARTACDFKLSDTIPEGKYRIRAYTKWMLNFDNAFVFDKEIEIRLTPDEQNLKDLKAFKALQKKDTVLEADSAETIPEEIALGFFPEGGSLIESVPCQIAFKATDSSGKGCDAKGKVITSNGDFVCTFESRYLGMGKFTFTPQKNTTYFAVGKAKETNFNIQLPSALSQGFAMGITSDDDSTFTININTNEITFKKNEQIDLTLVFEHGGNPMFDFNTPMDALQKSLHISKSLLPAGITRITLYDNIKRPQCERLVYVDGKDKVNITITPDKPVYQPQEQVSLKIKTTDQNGTPVKTNLSLSVTDAGLIPDARFNIQTYLLLESEIRGTIEQPTAYFDTINANHCQQLDLLLLTQGWRDFVWKHLADSLHQAFKYPMEQGLSITGSVRRFLKNKPLPGVNISMYFPDLGLNNGAIRSKTTDLSGRFDFGNVRFFGSRRAVFTSNTDKNRSAGMISINDFYLQATDKQVKEGISRDVKKTQPTQAANIFPSGYFKDRNFKLSDTISLNEIKVVSRPHRDTQKGWTVFEKQITPEDTIWPSLGKYISIVEPDACILDRPVDVQFFKEADDLYIKTYNIKTTGKYATTSPFFVTYQFFNANGERIRPETTYPREILMKEVKKVRIFRQLIAQNAFSPDRTMFIVEVYAKNDGFTNYNFHTTNAIVKGYDQSRIFYAPTHYEEKASAVVQATRYWSPNINTDISGEATVMFYNTTGQPYVARIKAEGVTDNGVPFVGNSKYIVKK